MTAQSTPPNIGKYRIEHILGKGSMGVVYKAYDQNIDRAVAIKTIHSNLLAGSKKEEYLHRFRIEAQAAARCLHTNILTVFDYGEDANTPYIVMEYYNGTDLKNYLKNNEISITDALQITQQLLDGLQYAHLRGIVHRDLKPGNIFIQDGANIKISDFGVAKLDQSDITQTGQLVGTLRYMAPEMQKGLGIDHRTDLYSTGIILYELLILSCSPAPVQGQGKLRVDLKNKNITAVPKSCRNVIRKALAIEPDNRYQTAASFSLALQKLLTLDELRADTAIADFSSSEQVTEIQGATESPTFTPALLPADQKYNSVVSNNQSSHQWDGAFLASLESNLTYYIGPFAHVLIRKYLKTINNKNILIKVLAEHVPGHHDRHAFITSIIGSATPSPSSLHTINHTTMHNNSDGNDELVRPFTNNNLKTIEARLAYFIGPLANTIIKRVSTTVASEDDLYQRLAQFIPTEHEKTEFLNSQKHRMSI